MGLPAWSSVGYGSEEKPATTKVEPTTTRRSPIRRRSPTRLGFFRDPESGDVRSFRRYAGRRPVPPRAVPPHAPVPQHRRPYRPFVHSPLVPSIPPRLDEQLQVTIDALERACAESFRISSEAATIARSSSRPTVRALRSQIASSSGLFCDLMRSHINSLEQWELALRRNDESHSTASHVNFTDDIVSFIQSCDDGLRNLRDLHAHLLEEARRDFPFDSNGPRPQPVVVPAIERRRPAANSRSNDHWSSAPTNQPVNVSGGLGDRTRSASPDNDADAWDTMRMTLEPDDHLPTADSSFTSAAASASFSAPTDTSRSTAESDSASTSRTNLTVPPADDTACESDDNTGEPLWIEASSYARGVRRHLPWIEDGPASTWSARIGRDTPPPPRRPSEIFASAITPLPPSDSGFQHPFMPRSQSPLSLLPYQSSSEASSALEIMDESDSALRPPLQTALSPRFHSADVSSQARNSRRTVHLGVSPPPDSIMARASSEEHRLESHPHLPDSIPAVVRLALRYAERVSSSDDPHADPDLEHMRSILQSVANDGYSNMNDDEMWIGAGLASMVAENNSSRSVNRSSSPAGRPGTAQL